MRACVPVCVRACLCVCLRACVRAPLRRRLEGSVCAACHQVAGPLCICRVARLAPFATPLLLQHLPHTSPSHLLLTHASPHTPRRRARRWLCEHLVSVGADLSICEFRSKHMPVPAATGRELMERMGVPPPAWRLSGLPMPPSSPGLSGQGSGRGLLPLELQLDELEAGEDMGELLTLTRDAGAAPDGVAGFCGFGGLSLSLAAGSVIGCGGGSGSGGGAVGGGEGGSVGFMSFTTQQQLAAHLQQLLAEQAQLQERARVQEQD